MGTAAVCVLCVLRPVQTEQNQAKGPSCTTADYEIEHSFCGFCFTLNQKPILLKSSGERKSTEDSFQQFAPLF